MYIKKFSLIITILLCLAPLFAGEHRFRELEKRARKVSERESADYLYELTVLCHSLREWELDGLVREGRLSSSRLEIEADFYSPAGDGSRYIKSLRILDKERGLEFLHNPFYNPTKMFIIEDSTVLLINYRPDSLAFLTKNSKIESAETMEERVESLERECVPPVILSSRENMECFFRNPAERELEFLPFAHSFMKNIDYSYIPESYTYGVDDFKRITFFTKRISRRRLLRRVPELEGELERYFVNPLDDSLVVKKGIKELVLMSTMAAHIKRGFLRLLEESETVNRSKWFVDRDRLRLFTLKVVSSGLITRFEVEENPLDILNRVVEEPNLYGKLLELNLPIPADSRTTSLLKETSGFRTVEPVQLTSRQKERVILLNRQLLSAIFPLLAPPFRTVKEKMDTLVPRYQPLSVFGYTTERDDKDPDRRPIDVGTISPEEYRRKLALYYTAPEVDSESVFENAGVLGTHEFVPRRSAGGSGLRNCYLLEELVELFAIESFIKEETKFEELSDYPVHSLTIERRADQTFYMTVRLWPDRYTQGSSKNLIELTLEEALPMEQLEVVTFIEPRLLPAAERLVGPNLRQILEKE